jgi:hypothetical protein
MKLQIWPRDPDYAPTEMEIARAFVAAAKETGDFERLAAAVGPDGGGLTALTTRSRWLALAALDLLWPRAGLRNLARKLGYDGANANAALAAARQSTWWNDHALNRIVDAI